MVALRRANGFGEFVAHHRDVGGHDRCHAQYEAITDRIAPYASFVDPGATNVRTPSWEATGQLIAFIRNPAEFPIRRYVYWRPADAMVGLYKVLDSSQAVRVVSDARSDWPDGMERPIQEDNLMGFYDVPFRCQRKFYGGTLGNLTIAQASWPVKAAQLAVTMSQAMVNRTNRFVGMMETAANWGANTADANVLNGGAGFLDQADTNNYAIRKMVNAVVLAIKRATYGMVRAKDLRMIMSPVAAQLLGQSKEMADYVKQTYWGKQALEGDLYGYVQEFNLPSKLYGVEVVIEDCEIVNTPKGTTASPLFCKDGNSIVFCSMKQGLPGDQVGTVAIPNFSTFQWFGYGGELEMFDYSDPINKRSVFGCEENFNEAMPAAAAGYLVTNCLSTGPAH